MQALAAPGRDRKNLQPPIPQLPHSKLSDPLRVRDVDLVQRNQSRPIFQPAVRLQFRLDDIKIGNRVAARLIGGAVDHMHDCSATFDMAEEVEPEPTALAGACDQPRHVSNREADITGDHDTEIRHQGRKGIVGDLGASSRNGSYE